MLALTTIQYYLPSKRIPVSSMRDLVNVPPPMLKIFEKIYGLKEIAVCDDISLFSLLCKSIEKIFLNISISPNEIQYLIHTHTAQMLSPFGSSLVQKIKIKYGLSHAIAFSTTMQKCVSALKVYQILLVLLNKKERASALVMTGEIAFTPSLRLVPRTSIAGDASASVLISNYGKDHVLLAVETYHLSGYSKGFFLSDEESKKFDTQFIQVMTKTITRALVKAKITLNDIALILPHNVNHPTWKTIATALQFPIIKIYTDNISYLGHCFTSDGFINLALALENNKLKKGDYYLMAGCGMGFFFACAVFQY